MKTKMPAKFIRERSYARAYVISKGKHVVAQIHVLFPRDGAGTLRAECWHTDGSDTPPQFSRADGYGYDKEAAALSRFTVCGHKLANHCGETRDGLWARDAKTRKGWYLCNYSAEKGGYTSMHKTAGVDYLRAVGFTVTQVF